MSKPSTHTKEIQQVSHVNDHDTGILSPDVTMVGLTWVTFLLLLIVLYKTAWKPILSALDKREEDIRKSIENADEIQAEMSQLEETKQEIISKAYTQAKEIITESKQAASDAAKHIEQKSREEAQILIENAHRDIQAEKEKAQSELKTQSVKIAVELAEKLIQENLDETKNRKLIDSYIEGI